MRSRHLLAILLGILTLGTTALSLALAAAPSAIIHLDRPIAVSAGAARPVPALAVSADDGGAIYGRLVARGQPVADADLTLVLVNGALYTDTLVATTTITGHYAFANPPALPPGHAYRVRFGPNETDPEYVWQWLSPDVTSYRAAQIVSLGVMDIANVELLSPVDGATVVFPITFRWQRRPITTDSYQWVIVDPETGLGGDSQLLGYVEALTIPSAAHLGGLRYNHVYHWYIRVHDTTTPGASQGISFQKFAVTFTQPGAATATATRPPSTPTIPSTATPTSIPTIPSTATSTSTIPPTAEPTSTPAPSATATPTVDPTTEPTSSPTATPTPTAEPSAHPTLPSTPTPESTVEPSSTPSIPSVTPTATITATTIPTEVTPGPATATPTIALTVTPLPSPTSTATQVPVVDARLFLPLIAKAIPPPTVPTSSLTGRVVNATNAQPLPGALVTINGVGLSAIVGADGTYRFSAIPVGTHQVTASQPGFIPAGQTVVIARAGSNIANFALSPIQPLGQMRIVLEWGGAVEDLDSHLWLPANQRFHIYWFDLNRGRLDGFPWANLDVDDVNGYGPETISILQRIPGRYTYAVFNYSNDLPLSQSGARVAVYDGPRQVGAYYVPQGTGRWWKVFEIDGVSGEVIPINTLGNQCPASYGCEALKHAE